MKGGEGLYLEALDGWGVVQAWLLCGKPDKTRDHLIFGKINLYKILHATRIFLSCGRHNQVVPVIQGIG